MKCFLLVSFLLSSFMFTLVAAEDGELLGSLTSRSGRTIEKIAWSDTQNDYVIVTYPKGFDSNKIYHINFWFPGTGGKPSPGIEDSLENFIGIGLSYLDKDKVPSNGYATEHWKLCQDVERLIVKRKNLKVSRRMVSGVSKGGWMAYYMSLEPLEGLHGTAIIAAGQHKGGIPPLKKNLDHLAVFVGTGETDSNYPHAQMAVNFFNQSQIHSFCYEEWLEKGHVSITSPRVMEWLMVQGKRGEPKNILVDYCEEEVQKKLEKIAMLSSDKEKYIAVRHLLRAPTMHYVSAVTSDKVKTQGKELTEKSEIKEWLAELNKLRSMIQREAKFYHDGRREPDLLGKFVKGYEQVSLESKHPDIARRAAYAYMRNLKNHTIEIIKEEHLATTEYPVLKARFDELSKKVGTAREPVQADYDEMQELFNKLRTLSLDAGMKGFYEVEWHKKVTPDPKVKQVLETTAKSKSAVEVYSGLGF